MKPASLYNKPGNHHANAYVLPKGPTPLRYCDGRWTGHVVDVDQLVFDGSKVGEKKYDGRLRIDYHELTHEVPVEGQYRKGPMCVFLGGRGYVEPSPKYGHVWTGDIKSFEGQRPVPAGEGRGAPAPIAHASRVRVRVIPGDMHYKQEGGPGQIWATYGNAGDRDGSGGPGVPYTYLLWSFLQDSNGVTIGGGGQVRGLLRDTNGVQVCDVEPIKAYSWDESGRHNGFVWGRYVRAKAGASYLFGWMVSAHQHEQDPVVSHIV